MDNKPPLNCDLCSLTFRTINEYLTHQWSFLHHVKVAKTRTDSKHECELCKFSCDCLADFSKHLDSDQHKNNVDLMIQRTALCNNFGGSHSTWQPPPSQRMYQHPMNTFPPFQAPPNSRDVGPPPFFNGRCPNGPFPMVPNGPPPPGPYYNDAPPPPWMNFRDSRPPYSWLHKHNKNNQFANRYRNQWGQSNNTDFSKNAKLPKANRFENMPSTSSWSAPDPKNCQNFDKNRANLKQKSAKFNEKRTNSSEKCANSGEKSANSSEKSANSNEKRANLNEKGSNSKEKGAKNSNKPGSSASFDKKSDKKLSVNVKEAKKRQLIEERRMRKKLRKQNKRVLGPPEVEPDSTTSSSPQHQSSELPNKIENPQKREGPPKGPPSKKQKIKSNSQNLSTGSSSTTTKNDSSLPKMANVASMANADSTTTAAGTSSETSPKVVNHPNVNYMAEKQKLNSKIFANSAENASQRLLAQRLKKYNLETTGPDNLESRFQSFSPPYNTSFPNIVPPESARTANEQSEKAQKSGPAEEGPVKTSSVPKFKPSELGGSPSRGNDVELLDCRKGPDNPDGRFQSFSPPFNASFPKIVLSRTANEQTEKAQKSGPVEVGPVKSPVDPKSKSPDVEKLKNSQKLKGSVNKPNETIPNSRPANVQQVVQKEVEISPAEKPDLISNPDNSAKGRPLLEKIGEPARKPFAPIPSSASANLLNKTASKKQPNQSNSPKIDGIPKDSNSMKEFLTPSGQLEKSADQNPMTKNSNIDIESNDIDRQFHLLKTELLTESFDAAQYVENSSSFVPLEECTSAITISDHVTHPQSNSGPASSTAMIRIKEEITEEDLGIHATTSAHMSSSSVDNHPSKSNEEDGKAKKFQLLWDCCKKEEQLRAESKKLDEEMAEMEIKLLSYKQRKIDLQKDFQECQATKCALLAGDNIAMAQGPYWGESANNNNDNGRQNLAAGAENRFTQVQYLGAINSESPIFECIQAALGLRK